MHALRHSFGSLRASALAVALGCIACNDTSPGDGSGGDGSGGTGGSGSSSSSSSSSSNTGADSTGGGAPLICEPCVDVADCCEWAGHPSGAVFPSFPHLECPGAYPNNWTCTPSGQCINQCDPEGTCPVPGYTCVEIEGVHLCVGLCQDDTDCVDNHAMSGATCSGTTDDSSSYCQAAS